MADLRGLLLREIDPAGHRQIIMDLFHLAYGEELTIDQFVWKYEENPQGKMRVWSIWDPERDLMVACYGAYARIFSRNATIVHTYQRADSMVHPEYRRRGLFTTLMNAMNASLQAEGNVLFQYGYSNDNSAKAIRRISGAREVYLSNVYVYPIGTGNIIARLFPTMTACRLARVTSPLLRGYHFMRGHHRDPGIRLARLTQYDQNVEAWSLELAAHYEYAPIRTREFMNWKVFRSPHFPEGSLTPHLLLRGRETIGACVLYADRTRNLVKVLDLLCTAPSRNLAPCVAAIRLHVTKRGYDAITANVSDGIVADAFRNAGFLRSIKARCTIFPLQEGMTEPTVRSSFWHQMPIDRDNFSY